MLLHLKEVMEVLTIYLMMPQSPFTAEQSKRACNVLSLFQVRWFFPSIEIARVSLSYSLDICSYLLSLSNLQFSGEYLFFLDNCESSLVSLVKTVVRFCSMSGLQINMNGNLLLGINMVENTLGIWRTKLVVWLEFGHLDIQRYCWELIPLKISFSFWASFQRWIDFSAKCFCTWNICL